MQGDHLELLLQGLPGTHSLPSHGALMAVSAGLFLPTTWLPDLGALSYVGALGVVSALGLTGTGSGFPPCLETGVPGFLTHALGRQHYQLIEVSPLTCRKAQANVQAQQLLARASTVPVCCGQTFA